MRRAGLVCAALAAGCSGAAIDARSAAITMGSADTGDPAVVAVVARRSGCTEAANVLCSGTLVSSRVVVSSAHCLPDPTALFEVYFGNDVANDPNGQFVVVAQALADAAYDPTTHEHDLLLLALADEAPVAPIALPAQPLDASAVGKSARIVGFGATMTGEPPGSTKLEGTMTVSEVDAVTFQTTVAPSNSCKGDSGGPVFVDDGTGNEVFAGLTTSGDVDCSSFALNLSVAPLAAEIQAFIDQSASLPTGEPNGNIDRSVRARPRAPPAPTVPTISSASRRRRRRACASWPARRWRTTARAARATATAAAARIARACGRAVPMPVAARRRAAADRSRRRWAPRRAAAAWPARRRRRRRGRSCRCCSWSRCATRA